MVFVNSFPGEMWQCVAKGVIHTRKTEDFTNEKGLYFLVQSARNVPYILDEEAEEPITKL